MSGGTAITITGTGFLTGAKVEIGQGQGAGPSAIQATNVTVVSPTKITARTGAAAKAGSWNVFVLTVGGTSPGNASGDVFSYTFSWPFASQRSAVQMSPPLIAQGGIGYRGTGRMLLLADFTA
jgi:hypothetical protein